MDDPATGILVSNLKARIAELEASKVTKYQHESLQFDFRKSSKIIDEQQQEIERLRAADDDYKALEDMREKFTPEQIEVAFSHIGFGHRWAYEVGDYQKTLAILERGEVTKCDDCVAALTEDDCG